MVYWVPQWKFNGSYDDDRIHLEKAISDIFKKIFFDKVMYSSLDNQLYLNGLIKKMVLLKFNLNKSLLEIILKIALKSFLSTLPELLLFLT